MRIRRTLIASFALIVIVAGAVALARTRSGPTAIPKTTPTAQSALSTVLSPSPAALPTVPAIPASATAAPSAIAPTIPTPTTATVPSPPSVTPTALLIRPTPPTAAPATTTAPTGDLAAGIQALRARDLPATNSVTLHVLGGAEVHLDDTRSDYPASTVKLPIYLTLAHRIQMKQTDLTWETPITVQPADIVGGTGILQNAPGSTHTVREIAQLMILESDNVAANLILGRLAGARDTRRDHLQAGAAIVTDYLTTLGIRGMILRHGLLDMQAFTEGTLSSTTSAALAQLLLLIERERDTLDGAADVLALLGQRGAHNPWHPMDAVACGLDVQRIGGIYPASADRPGVRLDALIVTTPGSGTRYVLAISVPTTPALERTVETQIARFEGDVEFLLTGRWAQCVDSTTRQT